MSPRLPKTKSISTTSASIVLPSFDPTLISSSSSSSAKLRLDEDEEFELVETTVPEYDATASLILISDLKEVKIKVQQGAKLTGNLFLL